MVVVEHVVGVVGAGAVAGIWNWSRGGKGVPWRREGTVFLCMLPWVLVQQVSYTLARERAYFLQNGVGGGFDNLPWRPFLQTLLKIAQYG